MTILRQTFSDIADAIRAKGLSGTMKPIEMASKIGQIQQGLDYGYLTFTAEEATTLTLKQNGNIAPHKLLKSTNGVTWTKWENPATNGISLNAGQSVYLKADEDSLWRTGTGDNPYNIFSSTGKIKCEGDIRSLVKPIALENYSYFVRGLFNGCTSLTTAPELPSTISTTRCYGGMFNGCKFLKSAPELPATTTAERCYGHMFAGCTSLTQAPDLPATTLAKYSYSNMFAGCTSLTTAPNISAATLADYCCEYMLTGCTSLTQAPKLPATTLAPYCYSAMFKGCTSLTTAPVLPATTSSPQCYQYMFKGCTSLVQAPELPATTLENSCYQYMFADCTSLIVAPTLPATKIVWGCYIGMFNGCTSLKRIKMNASSGSSFGTNMFNGCTSLELVDMTGSTGVPQLSNVNNFANTNDTYKIVVPDSLYDTWIAATNWVAIASHIMKQTDWNAAHPDDILG